MIGKGAVRNVTDRQIRDITSPSRKARLRAVIVTPGRGGGRPGGLRDLETGQVASRAALHGGSGDSGGHGGSGSSGDHGGTGDLSLIFSGGSGSSVALALRPATQAEDYRAPPKIFLGKFPSAEHSGGACSVGRSGSAKLDGASGGEGEPDGASGGEGEPDGASGGEGEPNRPRRGEGEPNRPRRGIGELDGTSGGIGELDGTSGGIGELDGTIFGI